MTLEQLRIFLAVAGQSHMTRAASMLNLTQSAVSAAIAALEAQHGVQLFDRMGRGIRLTAEGEAFVPVARAVLSEAETARIALQDLSRETRGTLRIHASQTVASYWLPQRLAGFWQTHPGVEILLHFGNTAEVAQAILAGEADLGLVEGQIAQTQLLRRVVAQDEMVLVMAEGHQLASRPLSACEYTALDWVLREPGSGTRSAFEAHLAQMDLTVADLRIAMEMPSNEAVLSAVLAGDMVSMVSQRMANRWRGVHARRVDWAPPPLRSFTVLTHPQRHSTRAAQALLGIL